jgi:hypothetical protein
MLMRWLWRALIMFVGRRAWAAWSARQDARGGGASPGRAAGGGEPRRRR